MAIESFCLVMGLTGAGLLLLLAILVITLWELSKYE